MSPGGNRRPTRHLRPRPFAGRCCQVVHRPCVAGRSYRMVADAWASRMTSEGDRRHTVSHSLESVTALRRVGRERNLLTIRASAHHTDRSCNVPPPTEPSPNLSRCAARRVLITGGGSGSGDISADGGNGSRLSTAVIGIGDEPRRGRLRQPRRDRRSGANAGKRWRRLHHRHRDFWSMTVLTREGGMLRCASWAPLTED